MVVKSDDKKVKVLPLGKYNKRRKEALEMKKLVLNRKDFRHINDLMVEFTLMQLKLKEAGFDMIQPISKVEDAVTGEIVFTQAPDQTY